MLQTDETILYEPQCIAPSTRIRREDTLPAHRTGSLATADDEKTNSVKLGDQVYSGLNYKLASCKEDLS